jgi:8-hydroxy-5-deazaflavin:NADPH oxidoreductase
MNVGVLGTGRVGKAIATRLIGLGHEVMMGSRSADNPEASQWAGEQEERASHGTFADAAEFGELLVNVTAGALAGCTGVGRVRGPSGQGPHRYRQSPRLLERNATQPHRGQHGQPRGEIQRAFSGARVVNALNTMRADIMVQPSKVPGSHNVFLAGDDQAAKATVVELLRSFDWPEEDIIDIGDLAGARGLEMVLPLWVRLMGILGSPQFNFKVAK